MQDAQMAAPDQEKVVAVAMEAAAQLGPLCDGVVPLAEVPDATSRSAAFQLMCSAGPAARDGHSVCLRVPLVFPPGGGPA